MKSSAIQKSLKSHSKVGYPSHASTHLDFSRILIFPLNHYQIFVVKDEFFFSFFFQYHFFYIFHLLLKRHNFFSFNVPHGFRGGDARSKTEGIGVDIGEPVKKRGINFEIR